MKPVASLFAKILFWFFLNLVLVAGVLAVFFALQPQVNLHAILGQPGSNRLRTAGMLIAHDLDRLSRDQWVDALARHAAIHRVDFTLVVEDGSRYSSTEGILPETVMRRVTAALHHLPMRRPLPPRLKNGRRPPENPGGRWSKQWDDRKKPHLIMRTRHPTRYWAGIPIPLRGDALHPPPRALLLAVSDSVTGNGFFFDPLPWMVVAGAVLLISVVLWIPMVRHITRPLARMTKATERIARGRFDVSIHEPRNDEIGRLAQAINHMSTRLNAYVRGQKRFLGDVAHELGSPIARIQFGLGALAQRIEKENRERVADVIEDVDHMSKLVNELLAFTRADMGAQTVKLDAIDLLPVVQAAVKREAPSATDIAIDMEPGIRVVASPDLLTRALANLLRNAIKYAGDVGPISVFAEKGKDEVQLTVQDSGPGVPEDLINQLFEPFFRPEASRDRDSGGVGLGLAIVKTCIETCRGTVSARNLHPSGFAVIITLDPAVDEKQKAVV